MVLVATQVKRRRGTTAENDAFTGAEGEITVDTEKHELRVHDGETQGGFVIGGGSGSGYNIGDTFYTTRTDTALAGAVECDGGTYNTEDYEGNGSIGELLEAGKLDYISLTAYATAISTKGWCDKIGWNGTGTTSFRVPTLTPHIVQKNNIPVVGNGLTLGLTNGTKNVGLATRSGQGDGNQHFPNGNAYGISVTATGPADSDTYGAFGVTTDPAKSGIIADTSDTAQLRVMFQLFNSTTDEAVATVGTITAQVGELNSHRVIDFQIPTAENGYTWYRKYADGWVEQGGITATNGSNPTPVTLPVEMADANYIPFIQGRTSSDGYSGATWQVMPVNTATSTQTSTQFYTQGSITGYNLPFGWRVEGMAAE